MTYNKKNRVLIEIFFFIVLYFFSSDSNFQASWGFWGRNILMYLVLYLHTMINRVFIFNYLFPKKQIAIYVLLTILNSIPFTFFLQWMAAYTDNWIYLGYNYDLGFFESFSSIMLSLFVLSSIEFFFRYLQLMEAQKERDKILFEFENNNLKAQLNPHFLFNSLNNAYGLSLTEPNRVPDYILSLSQLMRYQIESIKKEFVDLKYELSFIDNYLSIEGERVSNRCKINFSNSIPKDIQNQFQIPPLLFLNILENSIKHGTNTVEKCFVDVNVKLKNACLYFNCENSIPSRKLPVKSTQTGLKNLEKRLELLDIKHHFEAQQLEKTYFVKFHIQLKTK